MIRPHAQSILPTLAGFVGMAVAAGLPLAVPITAGPIAFVAGGAILASAIAWSGLAARRADARARRIGEMVPDPAAPTAELMRARLEIERLRAELARGQERASASAEAEVRLLQQVVDALVAAHPVTDTDSPTRSVRGAELKDAQVLDLIRDAVRRDRMEIFLQPVVSLPQRRLVFHEFVSRIRIRGDTYLAAERYIALAKKVGLIGALDNLQLLRGVQMLRDGRAFGRVAVGAMCNMSASTLGDPCYMGDLAAFLQANPDIAGQLVFEVEQAALPLDEAARDAVARFSVYGVRLSIDRVTDMSLDPEALYEQHVRYVKFDCQKLLQEAADEAGAWAITDRIQAFVRRGIDVVAEKVETERQAAALVELGVPLAQGFLFGLPTRLDGRSPHSAAA